MGKLIKGLQNPHLAAQYVLSWATLTMTSRGHLGTNVLSTDYDLIILLDTCRVDALKQVAGEYDFLGKVESRVSVGGTSGEWVAATFVSDYADLIEDTAYLSANGYAKVILEANGDDDFEDMNVYVDPRYHSRIVDWQTVDATQFGRLDHLWRFEQKGEEGEFGHPEGHSPPEYVTDTAIQVGRSEEYEKIILHYNQPHSPYTSRALEEGRPLKDHEKKPFKYVRATGDRGTAYEAYLDNLRYVLDEVETLLKNVDKERVLITADHGEAFGELGIYGHSWGSIHPHVRWVPWVETTAVDTKSYTPDSKIESATERSVEETLDALGYI